MCEWSASHCEANLPISSMTFRFSTLEDCALLAELNHQFIRDEGHGNSMTVTELEQRMRD